MGNENALVVKSNRLIEAGYRLTLVEQRVILLAIAEARRTGKGINGEDFVRITAQNYAQQFEVDEKNAYLQVKEARRTLFSRQFVLYRIDGESGCEEVVEARWVSAASYIDGAGAIRLQFSQAIVPYITRLEAEFTRYKLEKVAKMTSAYAIRLYELLIQWGSVGKREIDLEWLKKTLMVDSDYPRMFDFKKRVLDVALSQINAHSDLTASYAQRKTGRNVTHLIFTFAPKEDAEPKPAKAQEAPADVRDSPLFWRLRGLGLGPKLAAGWVRQDAARAQAAAEYVEARARAGQVKGPSAGYLRAVFESGVELGPSAFDAQLKAEAAQARAAEDSKKRAEAAKQAQTKADGEARERAKTAALALAPEARRALAEEYLQSDEYRQGEGATQSTAWDEKKGRFRDPMQSIPFNLWLQTRMSAQRQPEAPAAELKPRVDPGKPVVQ